MSSSTTVDSHSLSVTRTVELVLHNRVVEANVSNELRIFGVTRSLTSSHSVAAAAACTRRSTTCKDSGFYR